jgi:thioredoxin-like negative regulator of GroEL
MDLKRTMTPLPSQEFLESLLKKGVPHDPIVILKAGAKWCQPCKRLDMDFLLGLSDQIVWYEVDADEHEYEFGYCGFTSIPAFLAIVNGVPQKIFQSSDTMKVAEWMKGGFKA